MLSEQEQKADTAAFGKFVRSYSKQIALYALIGAILGFGTALLLDKEYLSVANVYPPSTPAIEYNIDNPNFGYDVEADRLIQIMQSNDVRDSVVKKFDLLKYYNLNKEDADWLDALTLQYKKDVRFERTASMSVLIKAQTTDPVLSAQIVNYIIEMADLIREKLYKQNIKIAYQNALAEQELQKSIMDSAQQHLALNLRKNNLSSLLILASNSQVSIDIEKFNSVKTDDSNLALGSEMIAFKSIRDRFNDADVRLVKINKVLTNPTPKLYIIDKAEPCFRKNFPSITLCIAFGMIISCGTFITIILIRRFFANK